MGPADANKQEQNQSLKNTTTSCSRWYRRQGLSTSPTSSWQSYETITNWVCNSHKTM